METTTKRNALIAAGAAVAVGAAATWLILVNHPQDTTPAQTCLASNSAVVACNDPAAWAVLVTVLPVTGNPAYDRCDSLVGDLAVEGPSPDGGTYCARALTDVG